MRKSTVGKWLFFLFFSLLLLLIVSFFALAIEVPPGVEKLIAYERELALQVTFLMAFFAGFVTITSPCGFALVPAYLAVAFKDTKKSFAMSSAFSLGLLAAFVFFGVIAGFIGEFFNQYKLFFGVVSGIALLALGILLGLNKGIMGAYAANKAPAKKSFFGMLLFGFFFGAGWTPCLGPILVGILLLGANLGNIFMSTLLMGAYALGAALPLVLLSLLADKFPSLEERAKGRLLRFRAFGYSFETHTYNLVGGIILLTLGFLMIAYQGTFFFQTTFLEYVPWSMDLWSELNQMFLESSILGMPVANIIAGALIMGFIIWMAYFLLKREGGAHQLKGKDDGMEP